MVLILSLVAFVWFGVLGASALDPELIGRGDIVGAAGESQAVALFATLDRFPLAGLVSMVATVLVALFFVSGAVAIVMGMPSSGDILEPREYVVIWGTMTGAVAAVCLLADGLEGLQRAAIISATRPRGATAPQQTRAVDPEDRR